MTATAENELQGSQTHDERAWEIYYQLRAEIETPENIGKIITLDPDSGDYGIGHDRDFGANARLQARHPGVTLFGLRIGYEAYASFDGGLERLP